MPFVGEDEQNENEASSLKEQQKKQFEEERVIKDKAQEIIISTTKLYQQVHKTISGILPTKHRCQVIHKEIQNALKKIERMYDKFEMGGKGLLDVIKEQKKRQERVVEELDESLCELKKVKLHDGFLEQNVNKETLYDFRNANDIDKLKSKAFEELDELKNLLSIGEQYLSIVDKQYDMIKKKNNLLKSDIQQLDGFEDPGLAVPQNLTDEMKKMQSIVLELTSIFDKTKHIVNNPQIFSDHLDYSTYTESMREQFSQLKELQKSVTEHCKKALSMSSKCKQFQQLASEVLCFLEELDTTIKDKHEQLSGLQQMLTNRQKQSTQAVFDEIITLTEWYNYFLISYKQLLLECNRRRNAEEYLQNTIKAMRLQLGNIQQEEERHRFAFFNDFARYLPSSLCESIITETPKYDILPPFVQNPYLPNVVLSEEDIKKLEDEIKNLN